MELHIDLLKNNEKSFVMIFLGLLSICFLIFILISRFNVHTLHYAPILDGIAYGLLFLIGIVYSFVGFGFSFAKLFGKAFIIIDNEAISIKSGAFLKEQKVPWDKIKSIDYNSNKYHIIIINNDEKIMDFSMFDYSLQKDIKEVVNYIAKEKRISYNEI